SRNTSLHTIVHEIGLEKRKEGRQTSLAAGTTRTYTPGASGSNSRKQRTVMCYNCKWEGHMSKQCTKPKRKQDDSWFKDKVLLVQAQASGQILHEEELAFLADPGISEVALMANLSHYGSDALAEVHNHDNMNNNMINQAVQAMPSSEQSNVVNHSETEITSDSNIIPYSQYVIESQQAAVQNSNSLLSVIEQLKTQVVNCTKINLDNKSVNDTLTAELERYKEQVKVLKEGQNVDLRSNDTVSDSSAQSVEIDRLKQTLSEHLKEKESLMKTVTLLKNDFKKEESRVVCVIEQVAVRSGMDLKIAELEGFHQVIDFLARSHICYALTKKAAVSVSFIKQFWRSAEATTDDNGEVKITATIDGHSMTITEASLRRHLNPKKTAWEQFSSNIATAVISEHHFPTPHDSPLHAVHSHRSDEGSLKLNELTNLVTKLSERIGVLEDELRTTKKTYSSAFTKLILRVKKLESQIKTGKARKKARIVHSDDEDIEDDSSKQGRKLSDAEVQEKAMRKGVLQDELIGATKGTASEVPVVSTAEENISTIGITVTYTRRSEEQRKRKDNGKAIMTEPEPKKKSKKEIKQEMLSFIEATRLEEQMNEEQRAQIARDEEIARQWDEEERQRAIKKSLPRKRRTVKRQKLEEDAEKEELKGFLDIIPREEFAEDVESLSTKYPIVDWKTYTLTENFMYYQIFRGDGSSKNYKVLSEMLEDLKQDVEELLQISQLKGTQPSGPTKPIADEAANEENKPTPSNDLLLSGEDGDFKFEVESQEVTEERRVKNSQAQKTIHEVTLVDETQGRYGDDLVFDTSVLDGEEVFAGQDVVEKEVSTADPVTIAGEVVTTASVEVSAASTTPISVAATTITTTTTTVADEVKMTLAQTLIEIKSAKPKVVVERTNKDCEELLSSTKLKKRTSKTCKREADRLLVERLQAREQEGLTDEENARMFVELLEKRKNTLPALRAQEKRKAPTKAQNLKEGKIASIKIIRADGSSMRYSAVIHMLRSFDREDFGNSMEK
ncbi:retrovirus-related pol polyprotein from transposon TNT 1-94, partial [Tanacetum coccineum]